MDIYLKALGPGQQYVLHAIQCIRQTIQVDGYVPRRCAPLALRRAPCASFGAALTVLARRLRMCAAAWLADWRTAR